MAPDDLPDRGGVGGVLGARRGSRAGGRPRNEGKRRLGGGGDPSHSSKGLYFKIHPPSLSLPLYRRGDGFFLRLSRAEKRDDARLDYATRTYNNNGTGISILPRSLLSRGFNLRIQIFLPRKFSTCVSRLLEMHHFYSRVNSRVSSNRVKFNNNQHASEVAVSIIHLTKGK